MALTILQANLAEGFGSDHCALCGAALASVLEEVPCLHWFATPGPRGFRIDRLAPVFEIFDLDAAILFLQTFAGAEPSRGNLPVHRSWSEDGLSMTAIHWRRRCWLFAYRPGAGAAAGPVTQFELSILFDGVVMERARFDLGRGERQVMVTLLAKRRLALAASRPPERSPDGWR